MARLSTHSCTSASDKCDALLRGGSSANCGDVGLTSYTMPSRTFHGNVGGAAGGAWAAADAAALCAADVARVARFFGGICNVDEAGAGAAAGVGSSVISIVLAFIPTP